MDRLTRLFIISFSLFSFTAMASPATDTRQWVKLKASTPQERSVVANGGVAIESVASDYVIGVATSAEADALASKGLVLERRDLLDVVAKDFPREDAAFHSYAEFSASLKTLAAANADIMKLDSLGRTVENREIWHVTLSTDLENSKSKPGIAFLGGHHSREHLSVEVPLLLIEKLVTAFRGGDAEVVRLLNGREIHVVPSVNPDGKEYDVATGDYRYWRKNRGKVNGTAYGIDLNRNYGYGWGGGGASSNPGSDVYRGPSAFSEPETQAVKKFVEAQSNLTTLLSFHTFSELILYPWGHQNSPIPNERDHAVHKTMAETMAKWNGYEPIQSSELYIASGDTTDWSYGELGIISFTFELDPKDMFSGGFYPGAGAIEAVSAKNWRPCLYLIEYADNPYRVLEPAHIKYGLNTPLVE
jgi:carboxypeptidase T